MYFNNFPKIYYDFDVNGTGDRTLKIVTDITKNVRVRKQVLESITIYDEYDIQDGETPEILAEKFYGNPELHWIIMLVNERYDYIHDFPIAQDELDGHIASIYGEQNVYNVHHYEKNSIRVLGKGLLKVPSDKLLPENLFKVNDYLINSTTIARIDSINVADQTLTVSVEKGTFKQGDGVEVNGFREDQEQQRIEYKTAFTFLVPNVANPFTLLEGYNPITNYEYEVSINESKRKIKVIDLQLIDQFINEFSSLINQ